MSKRSQRAVSKPAAPQGPTTLADLKKLPVEEQRKILRAELAGIDRQLGEMQRHRIVIDTALAMVSD